MHVYSYVHGAGSTLLIIDIQYRLASSTALLILGLMQLAPLITIICKFLLYAKKDRSN